MGSEQVITMVLKVDLKCHRCYKKVKKVLCKFSQVQEQVFDEKQNTVTIKVVCDCPEKLKEKIMCKAGNCIKSIEIKVPKKSPPPPPTCSVTPTGPCCGPPSKCQDPCRRCCSRECRPGGPCFCGQCPPPPPCPPLPCPTGPTVPNTCCCGKPAYNMYGCEKGCYLIYYQSISYGPCIVM